MDKIDIWIKDRFGTPNTFHRQLLDNFIGFLEKELGYVRKDDEWMLPQKPGNWQKESMDYHAGYYHSQQDMILEHWVKVKEKSNG